MSRILSILCWTDSKTLDFWEHLHLSIFILNWVWKKDSMTLHFWEQLLAQINKLIIKVDHFKFKAQVWSKDSTTLHFYYLKSINKAKDGTFQSRSANPKDNIHIIDSALLLLLRPRLIPKTLIILPTPKSIYVFLTQIYCYYYYNFDQGQPQRHYIAGQDMVLILFRLYYNIGSLGTSEKVQRTPTHHRSQPMP